MYAAVLQKYISRHQDLEAVSKAGASLDTERRLQQLLSRHAAAEVKAEEEASVSTALRRHALRAPGRRVGALFRRRGISVYDIKYISQKHVRDMNHIAMYIDHVSLQRRLSLRC